MKYSGSQENSKHYDSVRSLDAMMKEALEYPILSPEEHQILAIGGRDKPEENVNKLVMHNVRFAVRTANRFRRNDARMEDIVSEALMGMREAAIRYEPVGVPFIAYAEFWMRAYIKRFINQSARVVNMPAQAIEGVRILKKVGEIMGVDPHTITEEDIARELSERANGRLKSEVFAGKIALRSVSSLNDPIAEDSHVEKQDLLAYEDPELAGIIDAHSMDKAVTVAMDCLDDRERRIINLMFFSEPVFNLEEVGDELELSRERIRQIKEKAFAKMRRRHGDIMLSALGRD